MNAHACAVEMMARNYTKTKRAENQAETRERIVAAALALHGEVGPAATTVSMIAERAGVQRHTVYAHLPDEHATFMACSAMHMERFPLPSPVQWSGVNDPAVRLREALRALYDWFARNAEVMGFVLRDAETNPTLHDVAMLRFGAPLTAIARSLGDGLGPKGRAALALAMSFHTWRTLTREAGLAGDDAAELMAASVLAADA